MPSPIEFYFDFSSPYGYIASEKIDALAAKHSREVTWRPFLLGAAFKTTGGAPLPSSRARRYRRAEKSPARCTSSVRRAPGHRSRTRPAIIGVSSSSIRILVGATRWLASLSRRNLDMRETIGITGGAARTWQRGVRGIEGASQCWTNTSASSLLSRSAP